MSTTAAQIEANRANAQRSTGPRSEQGKRASSANATREGLTSARLIVRPGEETHYESLRENLTQELGPDGEFQNHCFEIIVHAAWNIQRCIVLEGELQLQAFEKGSLDAMLDDDLAVKLDRLHRYKKMHENSQRKAVAELRRLQSEQYYRVFQHPAATEAKILMETAKLDAVIATAQQETIQPHPEVAAMASETAATEELQNEPIPPQFADLIAEYGDPNLERLLRQNFGHRSAKNVQMR